MGKEKCTTKYCRGEIALTVSGKPYCDDCWGKICDGE